MDLPFHHNFLRLALDQASQSVTQGGFPAGSVVVKDGQIIAEAISIGNNLNDPTAHSDTAAIRYACQQLKTTDLSGASLYSSVEPCLMCFGTAHWSGISSIFYACSRDRLDPQPIIAAVTIFKR